MEPRAEAPAHRQRRERKAHFGELVQMDGSFDAWLEERGPKACLMNLVDDATGTCGLRFEAQETTWGAVRSLRAWIAAYGVPVALYTDWKNVYVQKPTEAELAAGTVGLTQFGRMCARLGIRIIAASSPQAKGRVERKHGTHQDRLAKKMRRRGIADYEAANAFLTSPYIPDHNRRFAQPPAAPEDFHTPVPPGRNSTKSFGWRRSGQWATTGWCAMTTGSCSSSGGAVTIRRRAVPCGCASTRMGISTCGIAASGCPGPRSPGVPSRPLRRRRRGRLRDSRAPQRPTIRGAAPTVSYRTAARATRKSRHAIAGDGPPRRPPARAPQLGGGPARRPRRNRRHRGHF